MSQGFIKQLSNCILMSGPITTLNYDEYAYTYKVVNFY